MGHFVCVIYVCISVHTVLFWRVDGLPSSPNAAFEQMNSVFIQGTNIDMMPKHPPDSGILLTPSSRPDVGFSSPTKPSDTLPVRSIDTLNSQPHESSFKDVAGIPQLSLDPTNRMPPRELPNAHGATPDVFVPDPAPSFVQSTSELNNRAVGNAETFIPPPSLKIPPINGLIEHPPMEQWTTTMQPTLQGELLIPFNPHSEEVLIRNPNLAIPERWRSNNHQMQPTVPLIPNAILPPFFAPLPPTRNQNIDTPGSLTPPGEDGSAKETQEKIPKVDPTPLVPFPSWPGTLMGGDQAPDPDLFVPDPAVPLSVGRNKPIIADGMVMPFIPGKRQPGLAPPSLLPPLPPPPVRQPSEGQTFRPILTNPKVDNIGGADMAVLAPFLPPFLELLPKAPVSVRKSIEGQPRTMLRTETIPKRFPISNGDTSRSNRLFPFLPPLNPMPIRFFPPNETQPQAISTSTVVNANESESGTGPVSIATGSTTAPKLEELNSDTNETKGKMRSAPIRPNFGNVIEFPTVNTGILFPFFPLNPFAKTTIRNNTSMERNDTIHSPINETLGIMNTVPTSKTISVTMETNGSKTVNGSVGVLGSIIKGSQGDVATRELTTWWNNVNRSLNITNSIVRPAWMQALGNRREEFGGAEFALPEYKILYPVILVVLLLLTVIMVFVLTIQMKGGSEMNRASLTLLMAVAICDILTVALGIPAITYAYATKTIHETLPFETCYTRKVLEMIAVIPHTASLWLTVFLSVHRWICVSRPFKAKKLMTLRVSLMAVSIAVLTSAAFYAIKFVDANFEPVMVRSALNSSVIVQTCKVVYSEWIPNPYLYETVYIWCHVFIAEFIPCVLLVTFGVLLFRQLQQAEIRMRSLNVKNVKQYRERRRLSLYVLIVAAIVTTAEFPIGVFLCLYSIQLSTEVRILSYADVAHVAYGLDILLYISFFAIFTIYCVMSREFRALMRRLYQRFSWSQVKLSFVKKKHSLSTETTTVSVSQRSTTSNSDNPGSG